jgi:hypothetical protein
MIRQLGLFPAAVPTARQAREGGLLRQDRAAE